jgi:glycosyltransferase involved in cell wall biosynthesis
MDVKMLIFEDWKGPVRAWNAGLAQATGEYLVFGADDLWFHEGWLPLALDALEEIRDRNGLVGFNDGITDGSKECTHFLMTREFCRDYHGGVLAFPSYRQYWTDVESYYRATGFDRYRWASGSKVEHLHHLWGKSTNDHTYQKANPYFDRDKRAFERRQTRGFPNDFEPVVIPDQIE